MSFTPGDRNFSPGGGGKVLPRRRVTTALAERFLSPRTYRETMSSLWQRHFGCPKEAAVALGQTVRAARNQIDGDNGPAGHVLMNAMIANDEIVADVLRRVGHPDLAVLVEDKAARRAALEHAHDRLQRAAAILREGHDP